MKFVDFSNYLQKLDDTTSRNEMTTILAELFGKLRDRDIRNLVYLLDGRIVPLYHPLKFNLAEKMMIKAMAVSYELEEREVRKVVRKTGDVGSACLQLSSDKGIKGNGLDGEEVYSQLYAIAEVEGEGSVDVKIQKLASLILALDPLSACYVARIPLNKMRLGFSAMTVLDGYSWMIAGDKSLRKEIEASYNVRPDLGYIGEILKKSGVDGLVHVKPEIFTPILMARAERLSSSQDIIEKIGRCAVEPKIDGFRMQVHAKKANNGEVEVRLFTRSLEDVTFMYPDVVKNVQREVKADEVVFEGESVAYDPASGAYREFQATSQRKRKYGIEEMVKKIPLRLIAFDILYLNGESLLGSSYEERHNALEGIIKNGNGVRVSEMIIAETADDIEAEFDDAVSQKFEGVMAKRLDGVYQAGSRGWNWIKFKSSYQSKLNDTIDAVVMGYYRGRGKRNEFGIGAFLIGVYDSQEDLFVTIAKVGTGLTDDEWREMKKRCDGLAADVKPPLYKVDKNLVPDVWTEAEVVVEIKADEISRSAVHTAGRIMKASKSGKAKVVDISGYALRFPRLERFRDDRKVDDVTTLVEIQEMFADQKS